MINICKTLLCLVCAGSALLLSAQSPVPAPAQSGAILIMGATAHLGNGQSIPNSAIAFEKGQLTLVADATTIRLDRSKYSKIFDASGKHVYPGFIATDSRLGLVEIDAVRATQDFSEAGSINPNARAIVAYNTDSEVLPTVRSNGVLQAQVVPAGGLLSGSSGVVQLDAWNWEDATLRADDGIHLNWPVRQPRRRFGPPAGTPEQPAENLYQKSLDELHRLFDEARAYCQKPAPEAKNPRFEALRGLFDGSQNLYIHTSDPKSMQEAVLYAEQYGARPVLVGASEAWMIPEFLKEHRVAILLAEPQRLPGRDDDDYDQPYKTALALQQAGIPFAITGNGSWRQRNLPFEAGQAVGFGLPYEAAVQAITLSPAAILGIGGRTGSLETGKDATLFISEGDALDMRTCTVTAAFIQGREIILDNKQKVLYRKFEEKYKRGK